MADQPDLPLGHRSLADRLNRLFELHPADRGPYSNDEVAAAISAAGGPTISSSYLWLLRTGKRDNPTANHLQALANYFGVSPAYFFDDNRARQIDQEMDVIRTMRDADVRQIAMRASELSPDLLSAIATMVEQLRKVQGLSDTGSAAADTPATSDEGGPA